VLSPLAWSVGEVTRLRREAFRRGVCPTAKVGIPVISVGSLSMGGSGKTPVAALLARRLARPGRTVGVVCGAYRGAARRRPARVPWLPGCTAELVRRHGDEAVMLARWLPEAIVVGGQDKVAAAGLASELGADVIVVDDGFQHQRLHRDLDILVHGGVSTPEVFPLGPGREHCSALPHADLLWHHSRDGAAPVAAAEGVVVSRAIPCRLLTADGEVLGRPEALRGLRVCLMTGIAAPGAFHRLAERLGAVIVDRIAVHDHAPFRRRHFRRAARSRPDLILCTEKDLVRVRHPDLVGLACTTELLQGEDRLSDAVGQAINREGNR